MRTRLVRTYRGALILTPDGLNSLLALVKRHMEETPPPNEHRKKDYETLLISFNCRDGSSIDFESVENALGFQHPPSRRIDSITVSTSIFSPFFLRLHLRRETVLGVANLELAADDSRVVRFKSDFEQWLSTVRAIWSPFVYYGAFPYLLPCFILAAPALDYKSLSPTARIWVWSIIGASIGLYVALRFLFPSLVVAIGHGRERFERLKTVQKWIIGTAILGTLARVGYDLVK